MTRIIQSVWAFYPTISQTSRGYFTVSCVSDLHVLSNDDMRFVVQDCPADAFKNM